MGYKLDKQINNLKKKLFLKKNRNSFYSIEKNFLTKNKFQINNFLKNFENLKILESLISKKMS